MKITLKHIAKELNVSISTVSKALSDSHEISEGTRRTIQQLARTYNYKPNNIALSLKNRRTRKIGIIIPEIVHHFFSSVITGAERVANANGYSIVVCLTNESFEKEVENMEMLAQGSIDGFILSLSKETQKIKDFHHIREVMDQGMPVVLFDRVDEDIQCDQVTINDRDAAFEATNLLIDKGCKKIGLISSVGYLSVSSLRKEGFTKALMEAGLSTDPKHILEIGEEEDVDQAIQTYFENNVIDGLFAINEIYAATALQTAYKMGISVPEDLKLVGFTDGYISKYTRPALTVVHQNGFEIGMQAAQLLMDRLQLTEKPMQKIVWPTALIERGST